MDICLYVDIDHAGEKRTRRARTGFMIYINTALIQWLSKKHPTVQKSVCGDDLLSMKHNVETLHGLR